MHFAPDYLLNPHHPITVCVIGCGGTGTQVLSILGRMNKALVALGHEGLDITVFDDDVITEANVGRQLFSEAEIGSYKCISMITKLNRYYGTAWKAKPFKFNDKLTIEINFNIYITCIDSFNGRLQIASILRKNNGGNHERKMYYWLDFGNTNNSGQAILGTLYSTKSANQMPTFEKWQKLYHPPVESPNTPSCSLAEALDKQDLLINSSLANTGMQLLWRLFREGKTPYSGVLINLETLQTNPIAIKSNE